MKRLLVALMAVALVLFAVSFAAAADASASSGGTVTAFQTIIPATTSAHQSVTVSGTGGTANITTRLGAKNSQSTPVEGGTVSTGAHVSASPGGEAAASYSAGVSQSQAFNGGSTNIGSQSQSFGSHGHVFVKN